MSLILKTLKRFKNDIRNLSEQTGVPSIIYWIDAFSAFLIHGASPRDYVLIGLYKISFIMRFSYLTMRRAKKIERIFNPNCYAEFFNEKPVFNKKFSQFVSRDWIYCDADDRDDDKVKSFLKKHQYIICKPTNMSSGRGIQKINVKEISDIDTFISNAYDNKLLLEECIVQRKDINELNEYSVNTLRIYTIRKNGEVPVILGAGLRVGTTKSPVDNMHNNGIYYPIDVINGIIKDRGMDINSNRYAVHPTNGKVMLGYKIEHWDKIIEFVNKAADVIPEARFIGWDVAITDTGCEMVEGNYKAYIADLQVYDNIG